MTFSYTLFLALLLLAPGIAAWAGLQVGARSGITKPVPERPGSTATLAVIVFGALIGHLLLAAAFAVQTGFYVWSGCCMAVDFDPNVYRAITSGTKASVKLPDLAYFWWFIALLLPSFATFFASKWVVGWPSFVRAFEPATFGWLFPLVEKSRSTENNRFIVASVVTTNAHDGTAFGYEGVVVQLSFDENKSIAMLILRDFDMFLLANFMTGTLSTPAEKPAFELIHLQAKDIASISFRIIQK